MRGIAILISLLLFTNSFLNAQNESESKNLRDSLPSIDWEALQKSKAWEATESWENVPVISLNSQSIPQDAIILFSGKNLDSWQTPQFIIPGNMPQAEYVANLDVSDYAEEPSNWIIENNEMICPGNWVSTATKQSFGNVQLHIEWLSPKQENKSGEEYSNSGIFLMELYEVQILNSFDNLTYSNGQAGSIYKQSAPLVNVSTQPDTWQVYDIVFIAPNFDEVGNLLSPGYITVLHNGVLVQNHFELKGPTVYIGDSYYIQHENKLPLILQDHGDNVRFRNIWIREL